MKKRTFFVIAIIAVMLVAYEGKVNYEPKVKTTKDTDWEITANYPKFEGDKMANANKAIKAIVDSFYNDWEEFFTTSYERIEPDGMGAAEMSYQVFYADTDAVSILFETMEYSGGMHPRHSYITLNYDIVKKRIADVSDLMIEDYVQELADYCERDIIRQMKKRGVWDELTTISEIEPTLASFNLFNATRSSLYFTFNEGKLTGNWLGKFTVELPMDSFNAITD
ncbi:MAG: DUF4163 domain-containing protein [bacterium]|nr:DUF4163 domain-containing protein [bacterium]